MAIDWTRGYEASWRAFRVDPDTWADSGQVPGVRSATVERDGTGDAPLLESGSIDVDASPGEGFSECYVRLCMTAVQDGERERVDVATLLCSSASGTLDRGVDGLSLTGRSVLWPASVERLAAGSYAPMGCDGAAYAADMLRAAVAAPVTVRGSFTLGAHYVFDLGSTVLEASWLLLRAGGFCMQVAGDGSVSVLPMPRDPSLSLDSVGARLLMPSVSHEADWSQVPNRYVAVDGDERAEAVNDDPASETSTVRRGYVHDGSGVDTAPVRVNGETLRAYCARRLAEESTIPDTRTYKREWWPGVLPFSVVRGSESAVGCSGPLRVERQSLECGAGVTVTERAAREVRSWPTP